MTLSGFMPTREEYERLVKENEELRKRAEQSEAEAEAEHSKAVQMFEDWQAINNFHPRACKLMRKRKNFVVVAEDEPYFRNVYFLIKIHELSKGTWTDEDEQRYQAALAAHEALK